MSKKKVFIKLRREVGGGRKQNSKLGKETREKVEWRAGKVIKKRFRIIKDRKKRLN